MSLKICEQQYGEILHVIKNGDTNFQDYSHFDTCIVIIDGEEKSCVFDVLDKSLFKHIIKIEDMIIFDVNESSLILKNLKDIFNMKFLVKYKDNELIQNTSNKYYKSLLECIKFLIERKPVWYEIIERDKHNNKKIIVSNVVNDC